MRKKAIKDRPQKQQAKEKIKLSRAEKKEIAALMRQAKGDGKKHTAQQTIPYETMYPDGICRVKDSLFSKSIEFSDINYQLAQPDDKTATFEGYVKSSIENCMTILYRDPVLKDAICKNELTNKTDIVKPLFWKRNGSCITDVDMYQIQRYIETNYGISNDRAINKAISIAASERSYHPIRSFLESLQWDGKSRIVKLLPRFLAKLFLVPLTYPVDSFVKLKAQEQMLWVQRMNGIRARAEEIVLSDIVYTL